jgi:flagellar export protein FliJ
MKRYRFRLDTVLRVRKVEADRAAGALAAAQRSANAAAATELRAERSYVGAKGVDGLRATASFLSHRGLVEASALSVVASRQARLAADAVVDTQRDAYVEAAGRVTGLENLDDRQRADHEVEVVRQDALAVDDLVTSRHRNQPDA